MTPCFFCLRESQKYFKSENDSDISKKTEPAPVDNLFPLRHLSRFLNLFEDNHNDNDHDDNCNGNRKISKHFKKILLQFANDSMVSVCEICSKMMREFTELYHLMEVTKLRLNWCVQRMSDVMTKTNNQSSTILESEDDENLLSSLRPIIIGRMMAMSLFPPVPRVLLHKVRKRRRIDYPSSAQDQSSSQLVPPDVGASISNLVKLLVSKPDMEACPETIPKPASEEFVNCPHCHAQFKTTGINSKPSYKEFLLRQHTLQYHCDTLFPHHKLDFVTPSQFKKIVAELLFKDLIREDCLYCQEKFPVLFGAKNKTYRICKIKSHLIDFHFSELEDILRRIQEDPDLPRILEECNPSGKICECGVYIPNKDVQAGHDKFHCVFLRRKSPHPNLNPKVDLDHGAILEETSVRCSYCRAKFPRILHQQATYGMQHLRRHMLQYHLHHYFPKDVHKLETVTDSQFQKILAELLFSDLIEGKSSCVYCEKPFTIPSKTSDKGMQHSRIKLHYIENHYKDMEKKLRMIQEDPYLSAKSKMTQSNNMDDDDGMCPSGCGVYILKRHASARAIHRKLHCTMTMAMETGSELLSSTSTSREHVQVKKVKHLKTYGKRTASGGGGVTGNEDGRVEKMLSHAPTKKNNDSSESESTSTSVRRVRRNVSFAPPVNLEHFVNEDDDHDDDAVDQCDNSEIQDSSYLKCPKTFEGVSSSSTSTEDKDNTNVKCSYCRAKFTASLGNSDRPHYDVEILSRHTLQYHPHHYFPHQKLDTVSDSLFKKVLVELLFKDLIEGETPFCIYCEKPLAIQFKSVDKGTTFSRRKMHYIKNHYEELEKKLKMIQEDAEVDLLGKLNALNCEGRMCRSGCGVYITNKQSQTIHEKLHCININTTDLVQNSKAPAPGSRHPASCPYCRYECISDQVPSSMRRHMVRFHPQYYFPDVDYQVHGVTSDQFQKLLHDILFPELTSLVAGGMHNCPFCLEVFKAKDTYSNNLSLRRHLVSYHKGEVTERIRGILQDPELEKKLVEANPDGVMCPCGMYLPIQPDIQRIHEKFQCRLNDLKEKTGGEMEMELEEVHKGEIFDDIPPLPIILSSTSLKKNDSSEERTISGSAKLISCPYCRYQCRQEHYSASMARHHLRFHPQYYFPNVQYDQLLGITSDQFQRVLHDVLFPELTLITGEQLSCKLCDFRFKSKDPYNNNVALRRHLLFCHKTEVTNRLEAILQQPDLEERLVKTNSEGVSCPCGIYLPSGIGSNQSHHEKFQCNLKKTMITGEMRMEVDGGSQPFQDEEEMDEIDSASNKDAPKKKKIDCRESTSTGSASRLTIRSCPYCRFKCKAEHASASLPRHLLRFHPQYYFREVEYQIHGVTSDQFQRVLHDILFPELAVDVVLETGGVFSCKFCGYSVKKSMDNYSSHCSLMRHLVYHHMKALTERLEAIFDGPGGIEEKLRKANTTGVFCPCGMYLPNGVETYAYHEKLQCNLKGKEGESERKGLVVIASSSGGEMEVVCEEQDGGPEMEMDEEEDFYDEEEGEYKFSETIQMSNDKSVNEVFVDESDPLEL